MTTEKEKKKIKFLHYIISQMAESSWKSYHLCLPVLVMRTVGVQAT